MKIEQLSIIDVVYGSGYSNDKYTATDFTVVGDSFSIRFYTTGSGRYSFNAKDLAQVQVTYGIYRPLLISWFVDGVLQDTRQGTPDWGMTILVPEDEDEDYKYHEITFSQDENSYTSIGKIDVWMQEKRTFDNSGTDTTTTTLSPQEVSVNDTGIRIASVDFENVCGPYSISLSPNTGEFHFRNNSEIWFTGSRTIERSYTVTVSAKDAIGQTIQSKAIDFSIQNCNSSGACSEVDGGVGGGGTTPRPVDEELPAPSNATLSVSDCDIREEQTWLTYDFNITSEAATHYDMQVSRGNTFSIVEGVLNGVVGDSFQWSLPLSGTFFVRVRAVDADTGRASDWSNSFTMIVPVPDDCEINEGFEPITPETESISQLCNEQTGEVTEPEAIDTINPNPPVETVNPPVVITPPSGPDGCVGIGCGRTTGTGSGSNRTGTNRNQTGKAGCVGPGCFDDGVASTGAGPGVILPCTDCAPPIGYPGGSQYPLPPLQCQDGQPPRQVKITIEVDPATVEDETTYAVEVDNSEGSCYGGLSQGAIGGQPNYTSYGKLGFGRQAATGAGNGGFFYSNNSITVPNAICPDCITQKCFKVVPASGAAGTPTGSIIIDSILAGPSGVATSTKIMPLDFSDDMLCDDTPGYCCYPNVNGCKDNVTKENCQAGRGKWEKYELDASGVPLETCADDPCDPIGACCKLPDCGYTEQDYCVNVVSGVWESLDAGGTCDDCTTTTTTTTTEEPVTTSPPTTPPPPPPTTPPPPTPPPDTLGRVCWNPNVRCSQQAVELTGNCDFPSRAAAETAAAADASFYEYGNFWYTYGSGSDWCYELYYRDIGAEGVPFVAERTLEQCVDAQVTVTQPNASMTQEELQAAYEGLSDTFFIDDLPPNACNDGEFDDLMIITGGRGEFLAGETCASSPCTGDWGSLCYSQGWYMGSSTGTDNANARSNWNAQNPSCIDLPGGNPNGSTFNNNIDEFYVQRNGYVELQVYCRDGGNTSGGGCEDCSRAPGINVSALTCRSFGTFSAAQRFIEDTPGTRIVSWYALGNCEDADCNQNGLAFQTPPEEPYENPLP